MSEFTNQIFRDLMDTLGSDLDELGEQMVEDAKQAVSTPAIKRKGRWVSSPPGSNPYLRTGTHIRNGLGYEIERDQGKFVLIVYATGQVAQWVNDGTRKMASRPFMDFLYDRWVDRIPGLLLTTYR